MYQASGANAVDLSGNGYDLTPYTDYASGPSQEGSCIRLRSAYHEYFSIPSASCPSLQLGASFPELVNNPYVLDNLVSRYNFESGAFAADSVGTNTLTNSGASEDTTNFKEGSCSAAFVSGDPDSMYRTDANLSSDFPWKGGTATKFGYCFWYLPGSSQSGVILAKSTSGTDVDFFAQDSGTYIRFGVGISTTHNYADSNTITHDGATWYFVSFFHDPSDKSWKIRILNEDGSVHYNNSGTFFNDSQGTGEDFYIGNWSNGGDPSTMSIDKLMIFGDVLTNDEIDKLAYYTGHFSIVGKIKLKSAPSGAYDWAVVSKSWNSPSKSQYSVLINKTTRKLDFRISDDGSTEYSLVSDSVLALNTWYTFAVVYDKQYMKMYINGARDPDEPYPTERTFDIPINDMSFDIGRVDQNIATHPDMEIEYLSAFSKALKDT
jgi:hypothetical protein